MEEVNGDRVTAVRNPTIPERTITFDSWGVNVNSDENADPIAAPLLSEGANTPAAAPEAKLRIGPKNRTTANIGS